jgi:hypothetical protein
LGATLLFCSHLVAMMADPSSRDRTDSPTDQSAFGGLVILVVPNNPSDHRTGSPSEKRSVPRTLLGLGRGIDC